MPDTLTHSKRMRNNFQPLPTFQLTYDTSMAAAEIMKMCIEIILAQLLLGFMPK